MLEQSKLTAEMMPLPCPYCGLNLLSHVHPWNYVRCEMIKMGRHKPGA